ncbi:hypothetical protein FA10DRAFT_84789 [Acaromyces ingoldii]|uniref:Uncharacterized protein n=1 Tax=Acaromyces ingoldii TaxID=215250 RepID=A0A316YTY8_9BASI|nr:hypothetical protein FA10DRAFT_84789 [Acaromyces ingoldii]PWN92128.1 hypothetical protein FA10DRAFT_84789 [Acaromyces ingoldii]
MTGGRTSRWRGSGARRTSRAFGSPGASRRPRTKSCSRTKRAAARPLRRLLGSPLLTLRRRQRHRQQRRPHRQMRGERRPRGNLALRKDFDPERDQRDLDADPSEKDIGTDSKESLAAPRLPQLKYNAEERRELRVVTSKTRTRDAYPELTAFHAIAQEEDDFIPGLEDDEKRELAQDEEEDGDEDGIYIPRKGGRARKEGSLGLGAFWRKFRERISGTQDGAEGEAMEEQETEGLGMHPEGEAEILTPPRPIRSDSGSSDATESALRTSDSPLSQFIHDQRSQNAPQKGNPPPRIAFQQAHPPQIQTFKARQTAQIGAVESPELFAGSTPALSRASSAAHAEPSQTRDNARLPPPPQELAPADNKELVSNVTGKKAVQDSVIHRPPERQPAASVHPSVGTITSAAVSRTSLPSHGPAPVAVPLFASSPPPPPVVAPAQPLTATNLASHQSARIEPPPQRQLSGNSVITMTTTTTQQQQQQQQQQAKTAGAPKRTATSKDVKGRKISLVLPQPLNPEGQLPPPAAPVEAPVAVHAQPAPPPTTTSGGSVVSAPRTSKIQFAPESVGRKSHQQKNKVSAATATTVTKSWRDDPEAEPPKYPLGRVVQGGKSLAQLQAEAKQAEEEEKKRRREEEERLAMERRREAQRRQREEWERGQERERRRREQEQADAARHYQQQQQRAVDGGEGGSTIRDHRPRRSSAPVAPPAQEEARTWFFGKKKAKEPDPFTFLPAPSLMQASPSDLDDPFAAASSAIQQQQQSPTRDGEPKSGSNLVGVGASGAATSRSRHMSLGMIPHNQTFDVGSIITPRDMARHDVQVQVKPYPQGVPRPYEQPRHHYHLQQQQQQQHTRRTIRRRGSKASQPMGTTPIGHRRHRRSSGPIPGAQRPAIRRPRASASTTLIEHLLACTSLDSNLGHLAFFPHLTLKTVDN